MAETKYFVSQGLVVYGVDADVHRSDDRPAAREGSANQTPKVYPMVRRKSGEGPLTLHGKHCMVEAGEIHVLDVRQGSFVPTAIASNNGTGLYQPYVEHDGQIISN